MNRRPNRVWPGAWLVATLLVVPLLIGGTLAVWALAQSPLAASSETRPTIAQVGAAERDDRTATTVAIVGAIPFPVATQSTGTITALSIVVGEAIEPASTVMEVDGRPVTAYVSDAPLYREIAGGTDGEDVEIAQTLLIQLGLLEGEPSGIVDSATEEAIEELNRTHGYGSGNRVLTPASLLWIPADAGPPRSVAVRVGAALTPGTELFSTVDAERSAEITTDASDVDRVVTVGELTVELPAGQVAITDQAFVDGVVAIAGQETSVPATIALADPRPVGSIPSSAVVTDATGSVCFFSDVAGPGVPISATEGSYGLVDVDKELVGTPVLLNPRETREDLTCG